MNDSINTDKLAALAEAREMFTGTDSKAQCARVLEILQRGYMLNTFEASRNLDVYHCPARVLQLRAAGHNIITHWVTVVTEAGRPHRVGNYMLVREVRHAA
ncbi:helix-turn-helix domain-containing protein [Ideonella sp. A 288]|uniref:helix-turn-helix domain-containing protein n=1 Tax=Ideonella sp. A 288 TaxID=1962181 RepID=UPI000B4AA984|nr:helix-turn-helix domain-containing protein [Ideonella sp. A 288]